MIKTVLILTASAEDADTLIEALEQDAESAYVVEWIPHLDEGLLRLSKGNIDAILIDLGLPGGSGVDTLDTLGALARYTPIIALGEQDDDRLARQALQHGAQGYLSKHHLGSYLVPLSLNNLLQRKRAEEALYIEKNRAEVTLNSIKDAVIGTDMFGNVEYLNVAAEHMTGWSRLEALGHSINEVMHIVDSVSGEMIPSPVMTVLKLENNDMLRSNVLLIHRNGKQSAIEDSVAPILDWSGQTTGAVIVFHDVTASQEMSEKMAHLAQHDFLTNLPNRVLLNDRIEQAITLAERNHTQLAVIFLDLDNFKHINDSLGHAVGDKLLQSVATRLNTCVRHSDTVSRQGGDEFVVLLIQNTHAERAGVIASKMLAALSAPHRVDHHELYVTSSIGISVYPEDAQTADTLIRYADTAMYDAKKNGRNNYQFFEPSMNARALERQAIESHLRHAVARNELMLQYQPKVNLRTGEITGAEALLRWNHPAFGLLMPDRFVPIAEESGLIVPIGRWVLNEACAQAKRWLAAGLEPARIAVNISALEFRRKDFVKALREILERTGLDAPRLQLEITETVLMSNADSSAQILQQLKAMGVQLAVDDFGTGYSSLTYLKQFPIDVLKIDRSFVKGIAARADDSIIISAVIGMGSKLKQRVVAEGVEDRVQLAFLQDECCDEGQGYLFSRPVNADQFSVLLSEAGLSRQKLLVEHTPSSHANGARIFL